MNAMLLGMAFNLCFGFNYLDSAKNKSKYNDLLYDLIESSYESLENAKKFKSRILKAMNTVPDGLLEKSQFQLLSLAIADLDAMEKSSKIGGALDGVLLNKEWAEFRKKDLNGRLLVIDLFSKKKELIGSLFKRPGFFEFMVNYFICMCIGFLHSDYPFSGENIPCPLSKINRVEADWATGELKENLEIKYRIILSKICHAGCCPECRKNQSLLIQEYESIIAKRGSRKTDDSILPLLKIQELFNRGEYEMALQVFKQSKFVDQLSRPNEVDGVTTYCLIRVYSYVSQIYLKKGQKEIAKAYLDMTFSTILASSLGEGQTRYQDYEAIRLIAKDLRAMYLEDKQWGLMRNLEERCSKFGLMPLPKQTGE